ncbi:hypothetical protein LCM4573_26695 [Rhizobium sp. LCM 4573]|nr:hypothetical protein LCM4573_26695 [Rhizobium sp. LCM 4573]
MVAFLLYGLESGTVITQNGNAVAVQTRSETNPVAFEINGNLPQVKHFLPYGVTVQKTGECTFTTEITGKTDKGMSNIGTMSVDLSGLTSATVDAMGTPTMEGADMKCLKSDAPSFCDAMNKGDLKDGVWRFRIGVGWNDKKDASADQARVNQAVSYLKDSACKRP